MHSLYLSRDSSMVERLAVVLKHIANVLCLGNEEVVCSRDLFASKKLHQKGLEITLAGFYILRDEFINWNVHKAYSLWTIVPI